MPYEIKINQRTATVELLQKAGHQVRVVVDGKEYELDYVKVSPDSVSVLYHNQSFMMELIRGASAKQYLVNTIRDTYTVDIIDAEARYLASRKKGITEDAGSVITAPIPGRVIRVMVAPGEPVSAGQTLVVVSAMKMESDFKAPRDGTVAAIQVQEGQTVEARQVLVVLE